MRKELADTYECGDPYAEAGSAAINKLEEYGFDRSMLKDPRADSLLGRVLELPEEELKIFRTVIRLELRLRKNDTSRVKKVLTEDIKKVA